MPCLSWGNNTLTESFLGLVSVHSLVWETLMTGYVFFERASRLSFVRMRHCCGCSESDSGLCTAGPIHSCISLLCLSTLLLFTRTRVALRDREHGPNAQQLGRAGALKLASPSPVLKSFADLVSDHMPAMVIHDVDVTPDGLNEDDPAMELLHYTDAYEYLLHKHFNSKAVRHPRTMMFVCQDAKGAHRRLVVLWNARFMSAA